MNQKSFDFTEARLRALPGPVSGRLRYRDAGLPGLELRVTAGRKVFAFRSRGEEVTIGAWPALSVTEARRRAREIAPAPAEAAEARRAGRARGRTLADAWAELQAAPVRADGAAALRASTLAGYVWAWGHVPAAMRARVLADLTGDEVRRLRDQLVAERGAACARQVLALLCRLNGGALPRLEAGGRVQRPKVAPHARPMTEDELGAWLVGLRYAGDFWRVFWTCGALSALRLGNLRLARWRDIVGLSGPAPVWQVAAHQAKGRRDLSVAVGADLAEVLRAWRRQHPTEEYIFPSRLAGGFRAVAGPVAAPHKAWERTKLWASAVLLARALALKAGEDAPAVLDRFAADLEHDRGEAWRRRARAAAWNDTPLARAVARLEAQAQALGIDTTHMHLRGVRVHDLRASWASFAAARGVPIQAISKHLGHAQIATTTTHYAFLNDAALRAATAPAAEGIAALGRAGLLLSVPQASTEMPTG